ncbi:ACP S-malonyltransferase [Paenibacillus hexagrammi]|uniref:Malonyl-CoA:ACP transacylase (MAT) domain-containing protein n=1 Tax=Paenibacillus hexagrammi TaxID=2908839 RepID=A0ABY3SCP6_9BACL|nr:hypothetical protein [Paenibacillus sp. YPD9-1]UJF31773.1 hypothetical protein L0M14_18595 [Paenibacillus sp. YPD9-1]
MSVAFLFPGQGSQCPGMLHQLPSHPVIQATLDEATSIMDKDVLSMDTCEALSSTVSVQLALLFRELRLAVHSYRKEQNLTSSQDIQSAHLQLL